MNEMIKLKNSKGKHHFNVIAVPKRDDSGAVLILQDQTTLFKILEMKKDFIRKCLSRA